MAEFKRKKILVKKALQYATVAYMFFITAIVVAFHTLLCYWHVSGLQSNNPIPLGRILAQDVVVTVVFMGLMIFFAGLRGSHKIAGPLFRFEAVLRNVQLGDISDFVQLRKGDLLVDFGEHFNLALANLREFVAEDRTRVRLAVDMLAELRNLTTVPEVRARIQKTIDVIASVGDKLEIEPEWRRRSGMANPKLARVDLPPQPNAPSPLQGTPALTGARPAAFSATGLRQNAKVMLSPEETAAALGRASVGPPPPLVSPVPVLPAPVSGGQAAHPPQAAPGQIAPSSGRSAAAPPVAPSVSPQREHAESAAAGIPSQDAASRAAGG